MNQATFLKLNNVRKFFEDHVINNVKKIDRTKVVNNICVTFKTGNYDDGGAILFDIFSKVLNKRIALIAVSVRNSQITVCIECEFIIKTNYFKLTTTDINRCIVKNDLSSDDISEYISGYIDHSSKQTEVFDQTMETLQINTGPNVIANLNKRINLIDIEKEALILLKKFIGLVTQPSNISFASQADANTARYTISHSKIKVNISFSIDRKTKYTSTLRNDVAASAPGIDYKVHNDDLNNAHEVVSKLWIICVDKLGINPIIFMSNNDTVMQNG